MKKSYSILPRNVRWERKKMLKLVHISIGSSPFFRCDNYNLKSCQLWQHKSNAFYHTAAMKQGGLVSNNKITHLLVCWIIRSHVRLWLYIWMIGKFCYSLNEIHWFSLSFSPRDWLDLFICLFDTKSIQLNSQSCQRNSANCFLSVIPHTWLLSAQSFSAMFELLPL